MKLSPRDSSLHTRLGASRFSAEGFLGNDPRSPEEIITADRRTLSRLGMDPTMVADALTKLFEKGRAGLGTPVNVAPGIVAVYHESMGRIPSPFPGEGVFEKGEVACRTEQTGTTLYLTRLGIHLIRTHAFFQGKGSRYRIEPQDLANLPGLPGAG